MMKIPLTVVIPISDYEIHAENIEAILESVAFLGIEAILVLDNQPREAFDSLQQVFATLNVDGIIMQKEFNNPGGSRNSGMQMASRTWIAFWDCDDFPFIEETIKLIKDAESEDAKIAIGSYEVENLRTHKVVIQKMNLRSPQISIGLNPGLWRMIFKNEVLADIEFPPLSMGEDQVFLQRVINQESRIIFRNYVVYRYRTGVISQLTGNHKRTRDIIPAHELALDEYNPSGELQEMALTMLVRQELTILKHPGSSLNDKIRLCQSLFKRTVRQPEIIWALVFSRIQSPREKR